MIVDSLKIEKKENDVEVIDLIINDIKKQIGVNESNFFKKFPDIIEAKKYATITQIIILNKTFREILIKYASIEKDNNDIVLEIVDLIKDNIDYTTWFKLYNEVFIMFLKKYKVLEKLNNEHTY